MIVRLTELVINDTPIKFSPFPFEIPDLEVSWDGGYDHVERLIEGESFPDEIIEQISDPENIKSFDFDYDFEVTITCPAGDLVINHPGLTGDLRVQLTVD